VLFVRIFRTHTEPVRRWAVIVSVAVAAAACTSAAHEHVPRSELSDVASGEELDAIGRDAPCRDVNRSDNIARPEAIADFGTTAMINCVQTVRSYPGDGEWSVLIRQVAMTGLADVVAALQRPDEPPASPETYCDLVGHGPLPVLLANGADYLHPRLPETSCGDPQAEVMAALKAVEWRTVSLTRIEQVRTPESIDSDCEMRWKNELGLEADYLDTSDGGPVFVGRDPGGAIKVCLYHVVSDPDAGEFSRAVRLSGGEADELVDALTGAGPTGTCAPPSDFAVLHAAGRNLNVEIGGCWRVLRHDASQAVGSADGAALERLLSLR